MYNWPFINIFINLNRALAQTSCELIKPLDTRPTDGQLYINVDLSPMASPGFESGRYVYIINNLYFYKLFVGSYINKFKLKTAKI